MDGALVASVPACSLKMSRPTKPRIEELQARIGHAFSRVDLLTLALTHVSAASVRSRLQSYQRLEFLGDRVLGLAISEMLYEQFPDAEEGELSRRLSALVRKETCAEVARGWEVGPHLKLGLGEIKGRGRQADGILGDACEAIIGAVFLDAGFATARDLVRRAFGDRMNAPGVSLDPKTALQEWAQAAGRKPPVYREISRGGPHHKPVFVIAVDVEGFDPCESEGSSKRLAEQSAARAFMEREHVPSGFRRGANPSPSNAAAGAVS